jgi:POTRA domain, FtsQ-type
MPAVGSLVPSAASVAAGVALLALALGGYLAARTTSVFAVATIDVRGGTPAVRAAVADALAGERGASLLAVDGAAIGRRLAAIPTVKSFTYDRAFPHTLRVVVRREVPVLVVRRVPGREAFLVAASGKVLQTLPHARRSGLPRLWVKKDARIAVGSNLPVRLAPAALALAVVHAGGLPGGVSSVRVSGAELTLILGGGLEVRLGDIGDLRLKLAIARRILRLTGAAAGGAGYLDVAVPERPVLAVNPRVAG